MKPEEHGDWISLSASERACYIWPNDTELHQECRYAYVTGAADYAKSARVEALEAALREIIKVEERARGNDIDRFVMKIARTALEKDTEE